MAAWHRDHQSDPRIAACRERVERQVRRIDPSSDEGQRIAAELERDFGIKKKLTGEVILVDGYTDQGVALVIDDELAAGEVIIHDLEGETRVVIDDQQEAVAGDVDEASGSLEYIVEALPVPDEQPEDVKSAIALLCEGNYLMALQYVRRLCLESQDNQGRC